MSINSASDHFLPLCCVCGKINGNLEIQGLEHAENYQWNESEKSFQEGS